MRYLCEACERLAPPAAFRLEAGALVLTCARCGAATRASAAAVEGTPAAAAAPLRVVALRPSEDQVRRAAQVARSADPFAAPEGHCPKCVAPRRAEAGTCPHCGLVFANFVPGEYRPSGALAEAWLHVLGHWDDWEAHQALVSLAMEQGELAAAGRLYRLRLAQAPDDLYAQRGRDEVLRRASATAQVLARPEAPAWEGTPRLARRAVTALLLAGALAAAVFFFQQLRASMFLP